MLRKSFVFILLASSTSVVGLAQTPEPRGRAESRVFSTFLGGDGGYLGVQTEEVTKENFAKYGLREVRGVAIEKVVDGSPAQTAGLQNGDVIVKFNGEAITSVRKLTRLIGEVAPDHQAKVTILRGGDERELTATLGKRPTPRFAEGAFSIPGQSGVFRVPPIGDLPTLPPMSEIPRVEALPSMGEGNRDFYVFRSGSHRQIGIGVSPLTKQLGEHFGVESGVMINNVRENSPAAKAGLKAGDIVIEVEGKAVKSDGDLIRAISEKKEGDISLTIVRDRNRQTIRVTPEAAKGGVNSFFEFPETPDAPAAPGLYKLARPATPLAPMPLNELFFPGRIL